MSQPEGQKFGKYQLIGRLAVGGMAEVYRAKLMGAEGFEKELVIKRILPHFSEDDSFVTMFKDEARIAANLNHANLVQVFEFDIEEGCFYLAMEFIEGQDLKHVIDRSNEQGSPLSVSQCFFIIASAADGLHYAHTKEVNGEPLNIVHRDVSPHNVMVSYGGEVKVMDFGIAKAAARSTKTRAGTVKGKCSYMAPEQARGKDLDGRVDVFALGICLWEMLTRRRLFVGDTEFETLTKVLRQEIEPPSTYNKECSAEVDRVTMKALERNRDRRYETAAALRRDLMTTLYREMDPDNIKLDEQMARIFNDVRPQSSVEIRRMATNPSQAAQNRQGSKPSQPSASSQDATPPMGTPLGGGTHQSSDRVAVQRPQAAQQASQSKPSMEATAALDVSSFNEPGGGAYGPSDSETPTPRPDEPQAGDNAPMNPTIPMESLGPVAAKRSKTPPVPLDDWKEAEKKDQLSRSTPAPSLSQQSVGTTATRSATSSKNKLILAAGGGVVALVAIIIVVVMSIGGGDSKSGGSAVGLVPMPVPDSKAASTPQMGTLRVECIPKENCRRTSISIDGQEEFPREDGDRYVSEVRKPIGSTISIRFRSGRVFETRSVTLSGTTHTETFEVNE